MAVQRLFLGIYRIGIWLSSVHRWGATKGNRKRNFYEHNGEKNKKIIIYLIIILIAIFTFRGLYKSVEPVFRTLCEEKAHEIATIVTNEELLNMANTSYKEIATSIYNEYIALPTDFKYKVTDSITDEEMTVAEFNNNSEKYIIRIREKLPDIMKLYIKDNKIYYVVRMNEINKVCYYTHTDINMNNITKEIAEL